MAAQDSPTHTPVTVPPFACKLPQSLLEGLSDRDRYLYESNDEIKQAVAWVANVAAATANRVEQVHEQAVKTNGRVLSAEKDIREIKETALAQKAETAPVVRAYGVAGKLVRSRLFWSAAVVFVLVVLPAAISVAPAPLAILKAAVSLLIGI